VMQKHSKSYAVTGMCNSEIKHWRGELRGYAVTEASRVCACVRGRVCVRAHAHTCDPCVTA